MKISLLDHSGYAAAFKRLQEIRAELSAAEKLAQQLESELFSARERNVGSLDAQASARFAGEDAESAVGFDEKLGKARREFEVLRRAEKLAEEAVARERTAASVALCQKLRPEYAAIAREIGKAVIALGKAVDREVGFRDELDRADVASSYLPAIVFPGVGYPRESHGRIATWLREAVLNGYIEKSAIPEGWLESWGVYLDAELRELKARGTVAA